MRKPVIRIIALILVIILTLGIFSSVLVMLASAAAVNDATLAGLTIKSALSASNIALLPAFSPNTTSYTATVANSISSVDVTPAANSSNATVKVDGYDVTAGNSRRVSLNEGSNSISVEVTAEDTITKKTYTVTITRTPSYVNNDSVKIITADTTVSQTLTFGKVSSGITITFYFLPGDYNLSRDEPYDYEDLSMPADSSFGWTTRTKLRITNVAGEEYHKATLSNVTYTGGSSKTLELYVYDNYYFSVPIPNKYFRESSGTGNEPPKPNPIVQSVTAKNAAGQKLEKIGKDTPPFSVEVVFYDVGLIDESKTQIQNAKLNTYITGAAGFKTLSGTGGTVEVLTSSAQYPRFRATFKNIQSDGTSNSMTIKILYDLPEYESVAIGDLTFDLFQVDKAEETGETASLIPKMIIQEYSYGDASIVAGSEFSLDMKIFNTSKNVGVENVEVTLEPGSGFVIAAASNTVYFSSVAAGQTVPYSVALRAAASGNTTGGVAGAQTDYSVTVKFTYQYLADKKYTPYETSVKIAIPVSQLDRFEVGEITDYSQYMIVGDEGYLSVPVSNKGKSTTYNIEGSVKAGDESSYIAPVVNFGNLEAGKSGTVDMSIIINVPGEFKGEAVISYEDENMNLKQHTVQFSVMVDQPFIPPPEMPPENPGAVKPAGPGLFSIIFCAAGALLIALPIALYSIKRVKARGNEDIDESF